MKTGEVGSDKASALAQWERSTERESGSIKLEINNLIWMHGHPELTLREAEERAGNILNMILGRGEG